MKHKLVPVFVAIASFYYIFLGSHLRLDLLLDGSSSFGAYRVLTGEMPYRDFMVVHSPGYFYILAGLFKIFGPSLWVERVWQCIAWSGVVILIYLITSRYSAMRFGILASIMALSMIGRFTHIAGAAPTALFFCFLAVWACFRFPFLAGLAAACATLMRQDIGVYTVLTLFAVLAACHEPDKRKKGDVRRFLSGIASILVPATLYFLAHTPLKTLFFDLVYYPLRIYPPYGRLMYPPLRFQELFLDRTFYDYFAPVVCSLSVIFLLSGWHKPKSETHSRRFWPKWLLAILGCLLLSQAKVRPDAPHLLPAYLVSVILFVWILAAVTERRRWILFAALCLSVGWYLLPGIRMHGSLFTSSGSSWTLSQPRAKGIDLAPTSAAMEAEMKDYDAAIEAVRKRIQPGEKIFVGSTRHDRVCYGDPTFYFLAEASSGTRYHEMPRGVMNTQSAQREVIGELEKAGVRVVVLRKFIDDRCGEPNASSLATGSTLLDQYLADHFETDQRFGGNTILRRRF